VALADRAQARRAGYVVLHDSTIDGIATARPAHARTAPRHPGIGDKKLEHYGEELIELVKAAASASPT